MIPPDVDIGKVLTKITYLGLFMNLAAPVALIVAAMLLMEEGGGLSSALGDKSTIGMLFFIFLALSLADGIVTYMLRRTLPGRLIVAAGHSLDEQFEKAAVRISVIIFSLNLSHCIYGVVLAVLGAQSRVVMLFAALSLISYELFRPRESYLERILTCLRGEPPA
jgi:hypothetical protein